MRCFVPAVGLHLAAALLGALGTRALADPGPYRLTLETGAAWQSRNDVRIPGDTGTRFSMAGLQGEGPFLHTRITLEADGDRRTGWRFVVSPFETSETGSLGRSVDFAGTTFAPGVPTVGSYRFNSYRATYRYRFHRDLRSEWRAGVTLKVRDARVALRQGALAASDSNVGLVPLLHLAGFYALGERTRVVVDLDGLAAPQGRAIDLGVQLAHDIGSGYTAMIGLRTLEGGADNDRVYAFAWLNYVTAGVSRRF